MREGREALYTNLREGACVDVFAGHGVVGALGHVAVGVGPAVLQAVGAEAAALQKKRRKGGLGGRERKRQAAMEIYNDATKNEEAGERKSRREKKRKPKGPETPSVPTPKSTSKRQKERKKKRQKRREHITQRWQLSAQQPVKSGKACPHLGHASFISSCSLFRASSTRRCNSSIA